MKKIYSLIAMIMVVLLTFSSVGHVFAAEERELTNDEKAAFIVRDEWTGWVRDFTASLSELDKNATAKIYEGMDFYDMQYRFTEKYKKVPEYLDEEGKPTQKLKDMIKEKRKEINMRKSASSSGSGSSTEMIDWTGVDTRSWMSKLPNNRYLNDVNLPGTRQSAMYLQGISFEGDTDNRKRDTYWTQDYDEHGLFDKGFRVFDFGVGAASDTDNVWIYGEFRNENGNARQLWKTGWTLQSEIGDLVNRLNLYENETIVVILNAVNYNNTTAGKNNLMSKIKAATTEHATYKNYIYSGSTFPKLKDVRKKIVLMSRHPDIDIGIRLNTTNYNYNINSGQEIDGVSLYSEAFYNHEWQLDADTKNTYVVNALDAVNAKSVSTSGKGKNTAIIYSGAYTFNNSTSAAKYITPRTIASTVNNTIKNRSFSQGNLMGMVLVDFGDDAIAKKIIETNP